MSATGSAISRSGVLAEASALCERLDVLNTELENMCKLLAPYTISAPQPVSASGGMKQPQEASPALQIIEQAMAKTQEAIATVRRLLETTQL